MYMYQHKPFRCTVSSLQRRGEKRRDINITHMFDTQVMTLQCYRVIYSEGVPGSLLHVPVQWWSVRQSPPHWSSPSLPLLQTEPLPRSASAGPVGSCRERGTCVAYTCMYAQAHTHTLTHTHTRTPYRKYRTVMQTFYL